MDHIITILLLASSACLGAFLGILRSKILATKVKTGLHYFYYTISGLLVIASIIFLIGWWKEIFSPESGSPNWFAIVAIIISIITSIGLIIFNQNEFNN